MSLTARHTRISVNTPFEFSFDGQSPPIGAYLLGIVAFDFGAASPGNDQNIQLLSFQLIGSQLDSRRVRVTPRVVMQDASGNFINPKSSVDVAIVAWLGSDANDNIVLVNSQGIPSGQQSGPIAGSLQGSIGISQSFLSGFNMSMALCGGDFHVQEISALAGADYAPVSGLAVITSSASMHDDSGHNAANPTIDGGYLGSPLAASGFELRGWSGPTGGWVTEQAVTFEQPVNSALPLIQGFDLSYGSGQDAQIKEFSVGSSLLGLSSDNRTVTFYPHGVLDDSSGHQAMGSLSLILVGIHS